MIPKTFQTEVIVIKRKNFGEADKIITFSSKHYGKITCIAKGIRKLTSRKAASLDLFNQAVIFVVKGKNLDLVTEAKTLNSFSAFKKDLKKVAFAYKFVELVDRFSPENQVNRLTYQLLLDALKKLTVSQVDLSQLSLDFKKHLLQQSGFGQPEKISNRSLNQTIEKIIERQINSHSLLQKVMD